MAFIQSNIKWLRKQRGLTQAEFAEALDIKRSLLGAYEEGRAKPNYDVLISLAKVSGLSIDDMITKNLSNLSIIDGTGTVPKDISGSSLRVLAISTDNTGTENIEFVPVKASAGYLAGHEDPSFIEELPKFKVPMLSNGTFRAFEIQGDSMLPVSPGSIVVGSYVEDWNHVKDGNTYIVMTKNEGIVYKRVFNKISMNETLVLRSDNPSYPPYPISVHEVLELWKAELIISKVERGNELSMTDMLGMIKDLKSELTQLKSSDTDLVN